jgi:hypothetical protein
MGNRSLLFTADTIPTADHLPDPIRPLAEWNGLPPVHMILASAEPRRCQSVIWRDQAIGVAADYAAGVARLLGFLDAFAKLGTLPRDRGFAVARTEAERVLASDKHRGRYLLFETGDTFGGPQGDLTAEVEGMISEAIPATLRAVDETIAGQPPPSMLRLAEGWRRQLGLAWSDVLYYTPPEQV